MHPAPSLLEVYSKKKNDPRASHQQPMSATPNHSERPTSVDRQSPLRKGTGNSTSTAVSAVSASTVTSVSTGATGFTPIEPATFTSTNHGNHAVFDAKDEDAAAPSRRASRRRTGPLSPEQRQKAALIRKIGACDECKRRRVACQLGHHGLSEEEARKKYMPRSSPPELPALAGRPTSAGTSSARSHFDMQPMDVDLPPGQLPLPRLSASDARNRTPLPSGRSLEKLASTALPGIDSLRPDPIKIDLQNVATRVLGNRSRYTAANVLLVTWEDETDKEVAMVVKDLADVFKHSYQYSCESVMIPVASANTNPSLWLQGRLIDFMSHRDTRDSLKIVYYNGHSYLDGNRKMVITSPARNESASAIQWTGIQQAMEDACSDTLCIMDAPYFPSAPTSRQKGVLELLAACNAEEHASRLGRTTFSRALTDELRSRVTQNFKRAATAAELHANLLAKYATLIQVRMPEKQPVTSFPSPLYLQRSGNTSLPSIQLSPLNGRRSMPQGLDPDIGGRSFEIILQADRDKIHLETWQEWLRQMPEGIMNIRIDRP